MLFSNRVKQNYIAIKLKLLLQAENSERYEVRYAATATTNFAR